MYFVFGKQHNNLLKNKGKCQQCFKYCSYREICCLKFASILSFLNWKTFLAVCQTMFQISIKINNFFKVFAVVHSRYDRWWNGRSIQKNDGLLTKRHTHTKKQGKIRLTCKSEIICKYNENHY